MIEQHKPSAAVAPLHRLELPPEEPIDVGRYANALRRSKLLIAAIVVVVTGLVLLMSLALPKTYSAKATMLFNEDPTLTTHDRCRAPAGDDPEAAGDPRRARHERQAAARRNGHLARGQRRGVGRPDCQHHHDRCLRLVAGARGPHRERRRRCVPRTGACRRHRANPVGGEPAERGDCGPEGHARWRGADRAHPRAAERAVRERGDRRLGAPARRPGASADDRPPRLVRSATPASRSSRRCSSPCSSRSGGSASRRESASRGSSSGSPATRS